MARPTHRILLAVLVAICAVPSISAQHHAPANLERHTIERRAVEAVIWGMPAVNYDVMLQEMLTTTRAEVNQFIYWSRPADWKNQTLTPNPDAIYVMTFFNTKDGPIVIDVPPATGGSFAANIDDVWQAALEDAGPDGADKGRGGKYLILPPGYTGDAPAGFIVLRSEHYGGFALFRSNLKSPRETDVARSVAYAKRLKIYPLARAANRPPTQFTDVADALYDSTIPYDIRFFRSLDRVVQSEPWLERDRAMIDQLKSLGIEKGKPFAPDAQMEDILTAAAREAHMLLEQRYETGIPPFYNGSHWRAAALPEAVDGQSTRYANRNVYGVDARGLTYTYGFIGIKRLGAAQYYLMSIQDKDGEPLGGGRTYRLTVAADAPVKQYWSATAYDRETHALIRQMPRASRSSLVRDLQKNHDGTIDIYFGPTGPAGRESNWVPTDATGNFEVLFRLYGPEPSFFEKRWVLPDIEKVSFN